ncbi:MAG: hypothetical protein ACYCY5_13495 [Sulfuricella sp.]
MTTKEHPNGKMAEQSLPQGATSPAQSVDESRRRFGKSGLAASGVILTLASQPVLGQWACLSPSGFQSGNVSTHGQPTLCDGRTPGYWQTADWQRAGLDRGTCTPTPNNGNGNGNVCNKSTEWSGGAQFSTYFNVTGNATRYADKSLMSILWMNGTGTEDPEQLGAHIVAALLNAHMEWTKDVLTVQAVKDMFNEWAATGSYAPTAGVTWNRTQIVAYLQTTMTL